MCGDTQDCDLQEFLILILQHTQPPAIHQNNHFQYFYQLIALAASVLGKYILAVSPWMSCLCRFQVVFCSTTSSPGRSKKNNWFSIFLVFFLIIKTVTMIPKLFLHSRYWKSAVNFCSSILSWSSSLWPLPWLHATRTAHGYSHHTCGNDSLCPWEPDTWTRKSSIAFQFNTLLHWP
jgi:hypothetical protein